MEKSNKLFCVFINRHIIKKKVIIIISRIKSVIWVVIYIIGFIKKEFFIFIVMGCIYTNIELVCRGYTHPSMLVVGGLCGMLIGLINNIAPNKKLYKQCFISMIIVTFLEFISGYILNIKMGLNIWDYSNLPLNFMGQVSLLFSVFWFFISIIAIWLDDYLRYKFYGDKKPYDLFIYMKTLVTFRSSR